MDETSIITQVQNEQQCQEINSNGNHVNVVAKERGNPGRLVTFFNLQCLMLSFIIFTFVYISNDIADGVVLAYSLIIT